MAAERLPDQAARIRAATDFETNLVVLAGAGTGKTSLIVERLLNAIGSGTAALERIAAITFTEKAAGEMRERLASGLERMRQLTGGLPADDPGAEADRSFGHLIGDGHDRESIQRRVLDAMQTLDAGTVITVHGFCVELLRSWPFESGVDPSFAVDSGEWMNSLADESFERFLVEQLGPDAEPSESWERLLATMSISEIQRAAIELAGFGTPLELLQPAAVEAGDRWLARTVEAVDLRVLSALEDRSPWTPTAQSALDRMHSAFKIWLAEDATACRRAIAADDDLEQRIFGKKGMGGATKAAGEAAAATFKQLSGDARRLLRSTDRIDNASIGLLLEVVTPYVERFREEYLRRGHVDFDGLLVLTRELLCRRADVRDALKRRFDMLLVDEFQDTDPLQYEIMLLLAERLDTSGADPFSVELTPGKLFIVGDAKQSVYRFRGADYAAYDRAISRIVDSGGVQLDLVTNFRSVPEVLDPINTLFESPGGSWEASSYQPEYVPIRSAREAAGEPRVELWTIDLEGRPRAHERREAEGRVIAETIERWVDEERAGYEEFTILFRAFTNVTHYLRPLRERGIPFVVDGGREFLSRPEVGQLMATLRALSRPADQPALLAFLRSPAGGVSDAELAAFAAGAGRWSWESEVDSTQFPDLSRAFSTMRELSRETEELAVDALVRRVLERTLLLPLGAAAFEGAQRVANLQKLVAAAGELARDGALTLDQVIEALEQGRLEDIETDRPLADDAAQAVRITSIHRMKGLENRIVFIPDLARGARQGSLKKPIVQLRSAPDGQTLACLAAGGISNGAQAWNEIEEQPHERAEELRVLYVALTRARDRLVLLATPTSSTPWLEALAPWGYDKDARPESGSLIGGGQVAFSVQSLPKRRRPPETAPSDDAAEAARDYEEAHRRWLQRSAATVQAPSAAGHDEEIPSRPLPRQDRMLGMALGQLLHKLLEGWDAEGRTTIRKRLPMLAEAIAVERAVDSRTLIEQARALLDLFLNSPLAERLESMERIAVELPILMQRTEDGIDYRGSIDLLYRTTNGELVVADYKTDRDSDPIRLAAQYGPQLRIYRDAIRLASGDSERVRCELWMLRHGTIVPIEPSEPSEPSATRAPEQGSLF